MSQWGQVFTIAGVTVIPHIATNAFDPAKPESLIDDFMISDTEAGADIDRARSFLDPFRGKPYGELTKVLDEMCVVPVSRASQPSAHR
jgi:hypothetical protein